MLGIVTATTNFERSLPNVGTWMERFDTPGHPLVTVRNGRGVPYLGTVAAFRQGVDEMLRDYPEVDLIACLHDDVVIHEYGWDTVVERTFKRHPEVGLAGFGGAVALGHSELYQVPYDPMQLARIGYRSNVDDAEAHGLRSLVPEPVVCLDGFSQIGRREFWQGRVHQEQEWWAVPPWDFLELAGIVHHFYDGMLGCYARRLGWGVYYIPVRCRHLGGQTAVGDPGYQAWASKTIEGGDRGFWEAAHRIGYDEFRDVLPLRLS